MDNDTIFSQLDFGPLDEFLKLDECSCSALGNLKVDKTIILVSDIISFTYSDLTFPTKG